MIKFDDDNNSYTMFVSDSYELVLFNEVMFSLRVICMNLLLVLPTKIATFL